MDPSEASFRFYAELTDFFPSRSRRGQHAAEIPFRFFVAPTVKDAIEPTTWRESGNKREREWSTPWPDPTRGGSASAEDLLKRRANFAPSPRLFQREQHARSECSTRARMEVKQGDCFPSKRTASNDAKGRILARNDTIRESGRRGNRGRRAVRPN